MSLHDEMTSPFSSSPTGSPQSSRLGLLSPSSSTSSGGSRAYAKAYESRARMVFNKPLADRFGDNFDIGATELTLYIRSNATYKEEFSNDLFPLNSLQMATIARAARNAVMERTGARATHAFLASQTHLRKRLGSMPNRAAAHHFCTPLPLRWYKQAMVVYNSDSVINSAADAASANSRLSCDFQMVDGQRLTAEFPTLPLRSQSDGKFEMDFVASLGVTSATNVTSTVAAAFSSHHRHQPEAADPVLDDDRELYLCDLIDLSPFPAISPAEGALATPPRHVPKNRAAVSPCAQALRGDSVDGQYVVGEITLDSLSIAEKVLQLEVHIVILALLVKVCALGTGGVLTITGSDVDRVIASAFLVMPEPVPQFDQLLPSLLGAVLDGNKEALVAVRQLVNKGKFLLLRVNESE